MKIQRVYGYCEVDDDLLKSRRYVVKSVCMEYVKHLHTHVMSKLPNGEDVVLVPDCRHALWCECVHSSFGPLRGRVIRECASEDEAEEAVRVLTYGKAGAS